MKGGTQKWLHGVTAVLIGSSLAACSGGGANGSSVGTASGTGDGPSSGSEKPIEISWLSFNPPEKDGTEVQKALEEKFNVKFKNIRVERQNYNEQMFLKISAGEIPDVIYTESPGQLAQLAQQGVVAELPEQEIRDRMPQYAAMIDEIDPTLWTFGLYDNKSYGVPFAWPIGNLPFLPGYNANWLAKIGYAEPPKTLEEFEDVIRKFRNDDPDGNGKKDTYGISAAGTDRRNFTTLFGAYQARPDWYADENGVVSNGLISDNSREAFRKLQQWYKEDLIDPEFITKNAQDAHNDFYNGKVGIRDWMSFQFDETVGILGVAFKASNPDNSIVVGKPLDGPYGPGTAFSYGAKQGFAAMGVQVEKDPAKKQKIYEILEALSTDESTFLLASFGIEGKHYDLVDGRAVSKPEYASEANKLSIGAGLFYGMYTQKSTYMEKHDYPESSLEFAKQLDQGMEGRKVPAVLWSVPEVTSKYPDLGKLESDAIIKFITGEWNLDGDFDAFVEKWKQSGGQEITDAINEKYKGLFASK
ncbi:extracellular solute-binding protein [Cohnella lubricantis]|uniref:Extracellular solute-binding protein n=1 Tax=Cohnella lubricantis TaxID=2163172 RepID=A0A841TBL7_9BACL|nr:extracellular solute-binding protein [Cohnella lubricantis]MBB6678402.1 extracellular solute-binding protein [Cohnella lubricantis]MBP2116782.1 putative aldouronate transport system substrate-binding protein [Cohnella lubricantis]